MRFLCLCIFPKICDQNNKVNIFHTNCEKYFWNNVQFHFNETPQNRNETMYELHTTPWLHNVRLFMIKTEIHLMHVISVYNL